MTSALRLNVSTVLTIARMTLREASRRKVLWALAGLTVVLLGLNAWGFAKIPGLETNASGELTTGEARIIASLLLNLVMFTMSLVVALGTAFLAGPTLSGEVESGVSAALLARPVRRTSVLLGKWLGLVAFATGYVAAAGTVQFLIVWATTGFVPPEPAAALVILAVEATVLLTLTFLLSTVLSPMASGVLAVGCFGATWVAGVVGNVGELLGNEGVARIGDVSRVILPTDGLWHGAMNALQAPSALADMGQGAAAHPFLSALPVSPAYAVWVAVWLALALSLTATSFARRDI
jgi:ABC-type transport system involved in multi-copper enzyme maturation permease subunit